MRILVVEDNALVAMMLEDELVRAHHKVVGPVASASAARETIRTEAVDCALVDIDLSDGRTGGELAVHLHRERRVPVIFASGQPDLAEFYRAHAVGVLTKPIRPEDLLRAIDVLARADHGDEGGWPAGFRRFRPLAAE